MVTSSKLYKTDIVGGGYAYLEIIKTSYGLKFIMDELLPHKKIFDKTKNRFEIDNRDYFSNLQYFTIDWKERNGIPSFSGPIMVCFVHYYHGTEKLIDNDNRAVGEFINSCLNMIFVPTDNPEWLSYMCMSLTGNTSTDNFFSQDECEALNQRSHTEIYVFKDVTKLLKKEIYSYE